MNGDAEVRVFLKENGRPAEGYRFLEDVANTIDYSIILHEDIAFF
jgi:hypothetical protein